ncbi:MAG: cardiolipin synthase [Lachnospiraceae bacterium]|nr:cardiolipin synthase [Lachnospiraceae bacterium]
MARKRRSTVEKRSANRNGVRRFVLVAVSFILEVLLLLLIVYLFNARAEWFAMGLRVLALLLVLGIFSQYKTSAQKMPWLVLIMGFPVMGVTLYLLNDLNLRTRKLRGTFAEIDRRVYPLLPRNEDVITALDKQDRSVANIARYICTQGGFPVYRDTQAEYYESGEDALRAQIEAIGKAKKYIFLEYHAFEDAEAFRTLEEALCARVEAGVEVRILYDDVGSVPFITTDFIDRMRERGIRCRTFNPARHLGNLVMNHRDHRKITVIDGQVAFTGGYNIADEYFNITHPYGHWKDAGLRLTGSAAKSMCAMFLEMWNVTQGLNRNDTDDEMYAYIHAGDAVRSGIGQMEDALKRQRDEAREQAGALLTGTYVQPYADGPMYREALAENIYISIIERARDYVYISTPYLIITDEMTHALSLAAKRGVDVRIVTPGHPDKKTVYSVTRSYYHGVTRNGVRIFEYTPGFNHAKLFLSDDCIATCGTVNLDYRGLYLHFENGCLIYRGRVIDAIKADFARMFRASEEVTERYATGRSRTLRFGQLILRMFAPLL